MKTPAETHTNSRPANSSGTWLRLYVAGGTPNSARAKENLKVALDSLDGQAQGLDVQVIDVFKDSKRAIVDDVIVTPTLIGHGRIDRLVIMGDLADGEKLNLMLRSLLARD